MLDTIALGVIIFGIPILGAVGNFAFGRILIRSAKVRCFAAIVLFLIISLIPFPIILGLINFGSYLGMKYHIYFLFGENAWGLAISWYSCIFVALISNVIFLVKLFLQKARKQQSKIKASNQSS
jgi:hypothetical protein